MWFSFRTRLTQWENQHYVERNFTKMAWLWGHRASTRHSLEVQIVAQGVRMDDTVETRALRGFLAGVVYRFCVDRVIRSMPTVARKEPVAGFSPQPTPVLAQLFQKLGAE